MSWCFSFILKIENPCVSHSVSVWRLLLLWWLGASHAECHQLVSVKKYFQPRKILSGEISSDGSHKSECLPLILRNDAKTCHVAQHDKFVNYLFNFCSDSSFGTITKSVQGSRFDWKRNGEIERAVRPFIRLPSDTRTTGPGLLTFLWTCVFRIIVQQ